MSGAGVGIGLGVTPNTKCRKWMPWKWWNPFTWFRRGWVIEEWGVIEVSILPTPGDHYFDTIDTKNLLNTIASKTCVVCGQPFEVTEYHLNMCINQCAVCRVRGRTENAKTKED